MKFVAYSDPDFSKEIGSYEALVNPENYKIKNEQEYTTSNTAVGSSAQTVKYKGAGPGTMEVSMFFDGTGVISDKKVDDQIKEVKDLVYTYNGDIHEPNYLMIYWGTQSVFQGRLKTWNINYTMLDKDGTPIRAEVDIVLVASISVKKRALEERKNSADLTHVRTVVAGDTLPLMCYRIYGNSNYYLQVAHYNKITNFRNINPGDIIAFPPLIN